MCVCECVCMHACMCSCVRVRVFACHICLIIDMPSTETFLSSMRVRNQTIQTLFVLAKCVCVYVQVFKFHVFRFHVFRAIYVCIYIYINIYKLDLMKLLVPSTSDKTTTCVCASRQHSVEACTAWVRTDVKAYACCANSNASFASLSNTRHSSGLRLAVVLNFRPGVFRIG
jgi:hypothetical protein